MRAAGIAPVDSSQADTALVGVPNFLIEQELKANSSFRRSVLWRGPSGDYQILLVTREAAGALRNRETGPLWSFDQPLRTLLSPTASAHFLEFRTFRKDGFVKIIMGAGPSLPHLSGILRAVREDGRAEPLFFTIASPGQIVMLPIKHFAKAGEAITNIALEPMPEEDQRVMPHDDRLLPYLLLTAELSKSGDPLYSENMIQILKKGITEGGPQGDVFDPSAFPALTIGVGWYERENSGGKLFRWISNQADIVFDSSATRRRIIAITGQAALARVTVVAKLNGVPFFSQSVDYAPGGSQLVLNLTGPTAKRALRPGQNVITLSTIRPLDDPGTHLADPRQLAFRVFHVGFADSVTVAHGQAVTSRALSL